MTPKEILNQFFVDVNSKAQKVIYPAEDFVDTYSGFGGLPDKKAPADNVSCKVYQHRLFCTKIYRDEACATYKLIRGIEDLLPSNIEEIFWRCKPEVVQKRDFDSQWINMKG